MAAVGLVVLSAGCGSSSPAKAQPLDPPLIFLTVPEANVIGTAFALTVNVDGCQAVKRVAVLDHGNEVVGIDAPTVPLTVSLRPSDVSFHAGIAAQLSLSASATCDDGRTNTSQPQPGTFFPVAQVFRSTGGQLVPDFFVAEGQAKNVTFVGCNGSRALVRVNTAGAILKQVALPFDCTVATSITDKNAATGLRWLITPGLGAIAFDSNLTITASAEDGAGHSLNPSFLAVASDGDAIVMGQPGTGTNWIFRVPHTNCTSGPPCGPPTWSIGSAIQRLPEGNPVIVSNTVYLPLANDPLAGTEYFEVATFDYDSGSNTDELEVGYTQYDVNVPPHIAMSFSPDGSRVFLPFDASSPAGTFTTEGCPTAAGSAPDCTDGWEATSMMGSALVAAPFAPYVAAIGSQNTYFFDAASGANVGQGGQPLTSSGALVTLAYQLGHGSDFYLLNGPSGSAPTEIVGIDSPQNGELFRVQIPGGSLSIAIADDGIGWIRVGNDLMQLLPLTEYRQLRGP